ncbi:2-amino-4-hydroxy-6-hydroxymethyldihydropteridine diphosphokinase [Ureibacillus sp. FSL K6-8385]|uniref:2-amino-4-hydroxy-6-hydroxymethyldihydropteridine diphosphokinase n=1 Tax=Ureibacillus terrenus TaxID=118246 RepID=A0A540UY90_9BACL|nr:2-amino-4-hydroxy-6-hydroxymethyldihydropteridine diphosphokinase [Ureibacillus terrenus]MED3662416.1 2-amino-4-hydroxy-6-hydroxymethyldihydropteridine diphosphokinase [Ureibacillus terrenus]MED3763184.1 2-amino-4-hydroxy-6-hydroxymethyldihydropteridine diphosphokinase [Ureibacillus terrenus]TQE89455.1 2-amino-4-hydroxy-6-hydroxymethyldihydropteridine diphosphokinase [Ureibacillus terrenus]
MNDVYLSLGTNLGDREKHLKEAIKLLQQQEGIVIQKVSPIYETAPVGYVNQPSFLNMALYAQTTLTPFELLEKCQSIEHDLGRVRTIRWGPRTIDLDILLYNNDNIESEKLIIPHPRMFERAFVLVPLMDVAKKPYTEKLQQAETALRNMDIEKEGIRKWKDSFPL